MKKVIATLSIILILLNIFVPRTRADISQEAVNSLFYQGTAGLPTKNNGYVPQKLENGTNSRSSIITTLLQVLSLLPKIVNGIMSDIALHGQKNYISEDGKAYSIYTIQDMLLDKYYLFNIDFFDTSSHNDPNSNTINSIKENVSIWYATIRNISLIGSALVIVYVAIRLSLATVSDGKGRPGETARYKKMIMSWIVGFILIFILPYLVRFIFDVSNMLTKFIYTAIEQGTTEADLEKIILVNSEKGIQAARGINKLLYVLLYFAIVYYQLKFFLMYLKRSFETFFLMIISPLVCMLYPIDNIGDGRSQSFKIWFQKLIENILLRPIHLFIYVIFIFTASELAVLQPIIAIAFFAALSNGERIIKTILGLGGPNIKDQKIPKLKMPRIRR